MSKLQGAQKEHDTTPKDHGRPTHKVRITSTVTGEPRHWVEWAWCPICLASKAGHYDNGDALGGGMIRVQYRNERGALRLIVARCTCKVGDKLTGKIGHPYTAFHPGMELYQAAHGVDGRVVKTWVPGTGQGVELEALR